MTFPEKLRALLKQHNTNALQLSKELGVSHVAIGSWLAGEFFPRAKHIQKLSVLFNVPREILRDDSRDLLGEHNAFHHDPEFERMGQYVARILGHIISHKHALLLYCCEALPTERLRTAAQLLDTNGFPELAFPLREFATVKDAELNQQ